MDPLLLVAPSPATGIEAGLAATKPPEVHTLSVDSQTLSGIEELYQGTLHSYRQLMPGTAHFRVCHIPLQEIPAASAVSQREAADPVSHHMSVATSKL